MLVISLSACFDQILDMVFIARSSFVIISWFIITVFILASASDVYIRENNLLSSWQFVNFPIVELIIIVNKVK